MFMSSFDYNTCLERFQELLKRYQVFTSIKDYLGVQYNLVNDSVTAEKSTWDAICNVHPLAYAYMKKREYDDLKFLFSRFPAALVAENEMVEVIDISSDTESMVVDHNAVVGLVDDQDAFNHELAWYRMKAAQTVVFVKHLPVPATAVRTTTRRVENNLLTTVYLSLMHH